MTCDACNRLLDKPTTVGPSRSLMLRDVRLGDSGAVETYKCEVCSTQWHRFKPDVTFAGKTSTWRILRKARLRG